MSTILPGTGAEAAAAAAAAAAADGEAARPAAAFGLRDLVTFYQQQLAAVNQLWAMYAATTFAAGLFAFNVGSDKQAVALLLAGALGFFVFDFGHGFMVYYGVNRLKLAARDISRILTEEARVQAAAEAAAEVEGKAEEAQDGPLAPPEVVRYLARPIRPAEAVIVHILIDLCVFAMFAVQLKRLGWG